MRYAWAESTDPSDSRSALHSEGRQGSIDDVDIADSARKHSVADDDMLHAVRVPFRIIEQEYDGEERLLVIGADKAGRLLEVVVVQTDSGPLVIHADNLRPKFYDYL